MLSGYKAHFRRVSSSKILVLVLGIQAAIIVLRTLNLYYTGFQTPDEANYILDVMIGRPYSYRAFFNGQLGAFFQIFGIDSISRFVVFFPFYLALWTFTFIILAYRTVGLITHNRITRDFVILTLPFAISYSLLSVGLLTEGPGLTMCMLGMYALARYSKVEKKWYLVAISGAAFLAAASSREPYGLFPLAISAAFIALAVLRQVPLHHAATFVLISILIAAPHSLFYGTVGSLSGVPSTAQTATTIVTLPRTTTLVNVTSITSTYVATITSGTTTYTTTTTTTYFATVTSTTASQVTTQVVQSSVLHGIEAVVGSSLYLFFYGLVLGWGPVLFVISLFSFMLLLKGKKGQRRPWLLIFLVLLSLGTFYGSTVFLFDNVHFYVTQGLSNLIRLTNTSLPAYILLSAALVDRMTQVRVRVLAVIVVVLTAAMGGFYVTAVQTNLQLPYNVIGFGHVSMQLQAREYLIGNASYDVRTVVFLPFHWEGAQLYLRGIPGLVMFPTEDVPIYVLQSNYTENMFLSLRPTVFYLLAESSLTDRNWTAPLPANLDYYYHYQSMFLIKTYAFLYHIDISSYPATPYTIVSVNATNSPTGHFLVVHVEWQGS